MVLEGQTDSSRITGMDALVTSAFVRGGAGRGGAGLGRVCSKSLYLQSSPELLAVMPRGLPHVS